MLASASANKEEENGTVGAENRTCVLVSAHETNPSINVPLLKSIIFTQATDKELLTGEHVPGTPTCVL